MTTKTMKSLLSIAVVAFAVCVTFSNCSSKGNKETVQETTETAETAVVNVDQSEFLKNFYLDYVLETDEPKNFEEIAQSVCTPKLLKFLQDSYEMECPEGNCYEISCFRTDNQDGNYKKAVNSVTALKDNWYKVDFIDMGHEGIKYIHFVEDNGVLKMDEISTDEPQV